MSCITRITTAAPALRIIGLDDKSGGNIPIPERPIPQSCPLWIFQSKKGPIGHRLSEPSEMSLIYGDDILTLTSPWANHQTLGMKEAMREGNIGVTYRVSKGERANISIGLDVARVTLQNYERDQNGRIRIDQNGIPVINATLPTIPGYSIKIVQRSRVITNVNQIGNLLPSNGVQTNADNTPSTYYPCFELMEEDPGSFGNNNGIMFYSPTAGNINKNEAYRLRSFPYVFSIISRENEFDSGGIHSTKNDETAIEVHFNPNAKSRFDDSSLTFSDMIRVNYNNTDDPDLPLRVGPYNSYIHTYDDNISQILKMVYEEERAFVEANPDVISAQPLDPITDSGNEQFLFNLFGGTDLDGSPYYTYSFDAQGSISTGVLLTPNTKLWAGNGTDKLMNVTEYEREVRRIIKRYGDCQFAEQDLATHPENWFYDTGFSFRTKMDLKEFISQRPDTIIAAGTAYDTTNVKGYIDNGPPSVLPPDWIIPEISDLTASQELQLGGMLEAEIRTKPESVFFGTPTDRAVLFVNSAESQEAGWNKRVNYTHYLIPRVAKRYGQANGKWKTGAGFSAGAPAVIRNLKNTSVRWIPYSKRVTYWKRSLNFPLSYNYDYDSMSAIQTIYSDDSSTLNALPNVQMTTVLWTIAYKAWREFRGTDDKTRNELAIAVKAFILSLLRGAFDDSYNIQVIVYFTKDDINRGYSWSLKFKVEQGTMYTVENVTIETYRFNQLAAADLIRA